MGVLGVDVSNNNGPVDWPQVASAGVRFAWVKATEGSHFVDRFAAGHVAQGQAAGVAVGCYHFARPGTNSAAVEAQHFLESLPASCQLRPVLDLEVSTLDRAGTVQWADTWLHAVAAVGHRPILYTYSGFASEHGLAPLGDWDLWLANYRSTPPVPPAGWSRYVAWQHADDGNVPGIAGRCDMNVADSLDDLLAAPAAKPPTPEDESMQYVYVRKGIDGANFAARHGCPPHQVTKFADVEYWLGLQGDHVVQAPGTPDPEAEHPSLLSTGDDGDPSKAQFRNVLILHSDESQQFFGV